MSGSFTIKSITPSLAFFKQNLSFFAPPFVNACYYGTDVDNADALIANKLSTEEIAKKIGVNSLGYLSIENVKLLTGEDTGFCTACFGGAYPTAVPNDTSKSRFETKLGDKKQEE